MNISNNSDKPIITQESLKASDEKEAVLKYHGELSSRVEELYTSFSTTLDNYTNREKWLLIYSMLKRDPVAAQALSYKAVRTANLIGRFSHSNKEIEDYCQAITNSINIDFNTVKVRASQYVYAFGFCLIEVSFLDYKLVNLQPLDPTRIQRFIGNWGKPRYIVYDNGRGNYVYIPWEKCIHLTNSNIASFGADSILGHGDGETALNYHRLKKSVLTQLAIASKNQSVGLLHVKTPNNSTVKFLDRYGQPYRDPLTGKDIEFSKLEALNKQFVDINSREYIVTEQDVELNLLNIKADISFWQFVLNYIDLQIQRSFSIPVGIFDTGGVSMALNNSFGEALDSTIKFTRDTFINKLINKVYRPLILYKFTENEHKNDFGKFVQDRDNDPIKNIPLLNIGATLIASGIFDKYDPTIINFFKTNLGLSNLNEQQVQDLIDQKAKDYENQEQQQHLQQGQYEATLKQMEVQMKQTQVAMAQLQQQLQMLTNPQYMQQMAMMQAQQQQPGA